MEGSVHCGARARAGSALDGLRVVGPHAEPLRGAIHALKYDGYAALAAPLGALLASRWQERPGAAIQGLLPVPLHPDRQKARGFNQSALLARAMAGPLNVPLRDDLLWRERATLPQVGLSPKERLDNVAGAFRAAPGASGRQLAAGG